MNNYLLYVRLLRGMVGDPGPYLSNLFPTPSPWPMSYIKYYEIKGEIMQINLI